MSFYKQIFMSHMDNEVIRYSDVSERAVRISYGGDNLRTIAVFVSFDKNDSPTVQFRCWEIANFKEKIGKGMIACNMLNAKYRWVKFYIDDDNDVVCECDAHIDENNCGELCMEMVQRIVNLTDEAYPLFMKALFD